MVIVPGHVAVAGLGAVIAKEMCGNDKTSVNTFPSQQSPGHSQLVKLLVRNSNVDKAFARNEGGRKLEWNYSSSKNSFWFHPLSDSLPLATFERLLLSSPSSRDCVFS